MAGALGAKDWLIIIALVIVALVLIYLFWPLVMAVLVIGSAYLIYKWYRAGRPLAPT